MKHQQRENIVQFLHNLQKPLVSENMPEQTTRLFYRNSPDGTLRWIWPASLKKPLFLRFYNTPSWRSRCIKGLISLFFRLRLQRLFASGSVTVNVRAGSNLPFDLLANNWSLFAGTPGIHQTALIFQDNHFYKMPVGSEAGMALEKEFRSLRQWEHFSCSHFEVPKARLKNGILAVNDIRKNGKQDGHLGPLHWNALNELARTWSSAITIKLLPQWQQMQEQLNTWKEEGSGRIPANLVKKLERLSRHINPNMIIPASASHGDFTPWNIFVHQDNIGLIDWELSQTVAPCLTDMFHFLYQQTSLVDRGDYQLLEKRIASALENDKAKKLVTDRNIDITLHHQLYLLLTAVRYLGEYGTQKEWHPQVAWSTRMWNGAVNAQLLSLGSYTQRQLLLQDLFDFLQNDQYAVLKWKGGNPADLSAESDLDICMNRKTAKALFHYLRSHALVKRVSRNGRSFLDNYTVILKDGSLLSVDAIWEFKRRNLVMMDAAELLSRSSFQAFGVKTPALTDDFTYTWLFYLLNGKPLPEKYRLQFSFFSKKLNKQMEESMPWKESLGMRTYKEMFTYSRETHREVTIMLKRLPVNRGWSGWKNKFLYIIDTFREHRPRRGFTITFSGVDGAGKSTVIENIRRQVEKRYRRKVVVLRHRPAVLPMLSAWKEGRAKAEQRAAERLPRQGNNGSMLSSLARFAYYFADYLFGQFIVFIRYISRGYVVIYDRYYFDFIHDGKRSNIVLPPAFTRRFYFLLLKPRFNFFLYADAETILKRKKELDGETIRQLTSRYIDLFSSLGKQYRQSKYVTVENNQLPETLELIHTYLNPAVQ